MLKNTNKNLPLVLKIAQKTDLQPLFTLLDQPRSRRMRRERREATLSVLSVLLQHCSLTQNAAITHCVKLHGEIIYTPLAVQEIATKANIHKRRTERVLRELTEAKLLSSPTQIIRPRAGGLLTVSVVQRFLTPLFWKLLNLTEQFLKDASYCAKKYGKNIKETLKAIYVSIDTRKRLKDKQKDAQKQKKSIYKQMQDLLEWTKKESPTETSYIEKLLE